MSITPFHSQPYELSNSDFSNFFSFGHPSPKFIEQAEQAREIFSNILSANFTSKLNFLPMLSVPAHFFNWPQPESLGVHHSSIFDGKSSAAFHQHFLFEPQ
ncbi:hypothetical protein V6Z11_A11G379500 [Gossypium hirsutum]